MKLLSTKLSKIRAGLLSVLILATSFTALPAQAQPTPHALTPSIYTGDIVAIDAGGKLWGYQPQGNGSYYREQIGSGWSGMRELTVTDWNQDYIEDILAVGKNGVLYLYYGKPAGGFTRTILGSGWGSYDISVGHWKVSDAYPSIIAANLDTGVLYNYPNLSGAGLSPRIVEGRGWTRSLSHHLIDFDTDIDGTAEILAKQASTGNMLLYKTDGNGNFTGAPVIVGKGWNAMNDIESFSGYAGDGMICDCPLVLTRPGLLARSHGGALYYYGVFEGVWEPRQVVGTGWNSYTIAGSESPRRFSF